MSAEYPKHLFHDLVPTEVTLSDIEVMESLGWTLVATTPADDLNALALHKELEQKHGEILHRQLTALKSEHLVGVNLYFAKKT